MRIASRITMTALFLVLASTAPVRAEAQADSHIMLPPGEISWGECPPEIPPGSQCAVIQGDPAASGKTYVLRAKMPDKFRIPPHTHPMDEHLTVLSGDFQMALGRESKDAELKSMTTGSFMMMPANVAHFAMTRGETILQVHGIGPMVFEYVNPADDPRNAAKGK